MKALANATALITGASGGIGAATAWRRQVSGIEALRAGYIAEAITYLVTRGWRVAANEMLVRSGDQTW